MRMVLRSLGLLAKYLSKHRSRSFTLWGYVLLASFVISAVTVHAEPDYAKWGTLAVKETQKRYDADIIDYEHIGRVELTPKKSEERFKLWLRSKEGGEFGVKVFIQFDPATDIVYSIRFVEVAS